MPVSLVSGLAGTVGGNPDPGGLQAFADHLQRAKESRRQDAMQQLNFLINLTNTSGGQFVPDPKSIEKLTKDAGLPPLALQGGGGAQAPAIPGQVGTPGLPGAPGTPSLAGMGPPPAEPGGYQGAFQGIAQQARSQAEAQAAIRQSQVAEARVKTFTANLNSTLLNPEATDEQKSHAMAGLVMVGDKTLDQAIDADAMRHLTPDQKNAMVDAAIRKRTGAMSEEDIRKEMNKLIEPLTKDFDGDVSKATQLARLLVTGQPVPTKLNPPMTDERLKREASIITEGIAMGYSTSMLQKAVAAGSLDAGKIGLTPKEIAGLKPLSLRQVEATEKEATAAQQRAATEASSAKAANFERIARAYSEFIKAVRGGADPEMKSIHAKLQALAEANRLKPGSVPKSAIDAAMNDLLGHLTTEEGAPMLQQEDVFSFWNMGMVKEWKIPPPKVDPLVKKKDEPIDWYGVGKGIRAAPGELGGAVRERSAELGAGTVNALEGIIRGVTGAAPTAPIDPKQIEALMRVLRQIQSPEGALR